MDKLKQHSVNLTEQNIDKIAALFPSVLTESRDAQGHVKRAINFDQLKQLLSEDLVEGNEAYEFTWVGKKAAILDANKPIRKTLRPAPDESKDWENTKNLYIEGDNLDVLKLLQESYLGKVKMIYIDPPYNTGQDFVYRDDFAMSREDYEEESGAYDEEGNRLFKNNDSNGRFHSDWCSMIYARLLVARNLLREDGVIFISIDDNEVENLKKICDEVFGAENFVNQFIWQRNSSAKTENDKFTINTEYILLFTKKRGTKLNSAYKPLSEASQKLFKFDDNDGRGKYQTVSLQKPRDPGPETTYDYVDNEGKIWKCPPKGWRMKYEKIKNLENANRLVKTGNTLRVKDYWNERENEGKRIDTLWNDLPQNTAGSGELKRMLNQNSIFDNPKPVKLIQRCLEIGSNADDLILDFFSGSATTAHAVMQLNAEDGGNRRFIMVQLPEATDEKSEAYKAGFKNICEIGKERIRRAGEKIVSENPLTTQGLDTGFRVLKVDSSNMKDVYYTPSEYTQDLLADLESNIKEERSELDLLFGCLVDWGLDLSAPISREVVAGYPIYVYGDGVRSGQASYEYGEIGLVACFAESLSEEAVKAIAKFRPLRVVFRDSSFEASPDKINVTEIFKLLSPDTTIRVI